MTTTPDNPAVEPLAPDLPEQQALARLEGPHVAGELGHEPEPILRRRRFRELAGHVEDQLPVGPRPAAVALDRAERILLDVQGVGYEVHVPLSTYSEIERRAPLDTFGLFIHTHLREGEIALFGFWTEREKLIFGVDMSRSTTHSLTEGLLTPFVLSAKRLPQILPGEHERPPASAAVAKTV